MFPWATRRPGYDGGTSWLRRAGRPAMGSRPWHRGAEVCRSRRALTRCPAVLRPGHPGKVARHAAQRDHATACKTLRVVTGLWDAATVESTTEDDVATTAVPTAHSDPRLNVKLAGFRVLCSKSGWSVRHLFPSPPPLSHSPTPTSGWRWRQRWWRGGGGSGGSVVAAWSRHGCKAGRTQPLHHSFGGRYVASSRLRGWPETAPTRSAPTRSSGKVCGAIRPAGG